MAEQQLIEQQRERMIATLKAISMLGGNLPDARLMDRTGPNDAAYRGHLYVQARKMATTVLMEITNTD